MDEKLLLFIGFIDFNFPMVNYITMKVLNGNYSVLEIKKEFGSSVMNLIKRKAEKSIFLKEIDLTPNRTGPFVLAGIHPRNVKTKFIPSVFIPRSNLFAIPALLSASSLLSFACVQSKLTKRFALCVFVAWGCFRPLSPSRSFYARVYMCATTAPSEREKREPGACLCERERA
jgi:hypothetical protein